MSQGIAVNKEEKFDVMASVFQYDGPPLPLIDIKRLYRMRRPLPPQRLYFRFLGRYTKRRKGKEERLEICHEFRLLKRTYNPCPRFLIVHINIVPKQNNRYDPQQQTSDIV